MADRSGLKRNVARFARALGARAGRGRRASAVPPDFDEQTAGIFCAVERFTDAAFDDVAVHAVGYDVAHGVHEGLASASSTFAEQRLSDGSSAWCRAPLDEVRANLESTRYRADRVHYVKGKVETTIPATMPSGPIALLRLDTDWYESTRHELEHLYPRLARGGVLIVDGHWAGARKAVDEYFAARPPTLLLNRIDYTARIAVKP